MWIYIVIYIYYAKFTFFNKLIIYAYMHRPYFQLSLHSEVPNRHALGQGRRGTLSDPAQAEN